MYVKAPSIEGDPRQALSKWGGGCYEDGRGLPRFNLALEFGELLKVLLLESRVRNATASQGKQRQ